MRIPKPWTKKRGKRLAGRTLSGAVGETVFSAALFLAGVFVLALMLFLRLGDASRFVRLTIPPGVPEALTGPASATGEASSSSLGFWIVIVLSVAMIVVGSASTVFHLLKVGASDERRSALASRAKSLRSGSREFAALELSEGANLPAVPAGRGVTESPGVRLAYRLASEGSMARRALATAALALLWNATWFVLLAVVISGFMSGNPRWVLAFLLIPFAGIGVWAFRYFLDALRQTAGVGATIVEISDHPLYPGKSYDLFVAQAGRLSLRRLRVELICEEETTFRQGTDVRIDRHIALTKIIYTDRDLTIDPHRPWEQELQLDLPADAMHSFRSAHNAVCWRITVSGDARPWPSFCLNFPVYVHPPVRLPTSRPR
ncbi:MAG: hypothetical protein ACO1RT_05015 [Planctomycetaceae bacterium]